MKTQDILNKDIRDVIKSSDKELSQMVSILRSTSRKRYERLEKTGLIDLSPSAKNLIKGGGLPTVKGMSRNQLMQEFKRYTQFLSNKTSTVKGTRKYIKNIQDAVREITGNKDVFEDTDSLLRFYELYDELEETEIAQVLNYRAVMSTLDEVYNTNSDMSNENIIALAEARLNELYERENPTTNIYTSKSI